MWKNKQSFLEDVSNCQARELYQGDPIKLLQILILNEALD